MEQKPKIHPAFAALIVIVLVGIVTSVVIIVSNSSKKDTIDDGIDTSQFETDSHNHSHDTDNATVDSTDVSSYKDGTYSASGSYLSPGGRESVELTVTIKDGVITDTSLKTEASTKESEEHQELFADNYKTLVVGKNINGLSLSRVAGSSLTSNGFNDALDEIRDDARA